MRPQLLALFSLLVPVFLLLQGSATGQGLRFTYPIIDYPTGGSNPNSVVGVDMNADGILDLVVANTGLGDGSTLCVFPGKGDGTFQPRADYRAENGVGAVAVGDLTGDGQLDVTTANALANSVSIYRGTRNGRLVGRMDLAAGQEPGQVAVADVNGDGLLDIAVTNFRSNTVSVYLAKGHGRFTSPRDYSTPDGPYALALVDLNLDGVLDLIVGNLYTDYSVYASPISVMLGLGDGTFGRRTDIPVGRYAGAITSGDFNADGKADLGVVNAESRSVSILIGDGTGGFSSRTEYSTGDLPLGGAVGDFDRDGRLDLAVTNEQSNTVSIFPGNGDGTLGPRVDYPIGSGPVGIAVGDFNGDGWADLAVTNSASNSIGVLLNAGVGAGNAGTLASARKIAATVSPNPLNPRGTLKFATSAPGSVTARLFDLSGRLVRTITQSERFEPGEHSLVIDGRDDRGATLATGVYFYRIETPDGTSQGRFVVAK